MSVKVPLEELLEWLHLNVGQVVLHKYPWNKGWVCSAEGRAAGGVTVNVKSEEFEEVYLAVEQCVQRVRNLTVNSRPLGKMLSHG